MKKCLIVCGPTASGKTARGIELAKKYNTSVISADSRQCYRELNIGVAKPSRSQLLAVPHFFIDTHSIKDVVTARDFEEYALQVAGDLFKSRDVVVMAGGTGLYIRAFAEGLDDIPAPHPDLRAILTSKFEHNGFDWLYREVETLDPTFFRQGDVQNPRRMLRALEVILTTGKSVIEYQRHARKQRQFDVEYVFLNPPREQLYQHIDNRTDQMIRDGLIEEARDLYEFRHLPALQTVGYQEIFGHMEGKYSLQTAIDEIKKNTRRYAKRQVTWFKKYAGT